MKVICVDNFGNPNPVVHPIYVGTEYTIKCPVPGFEDTHVIIEEHPVSKRGYTAAYNKKCFATIDPDLDETELVTEEFEEKYCVPVNSNV